MPVNLTPPGPGLGDGGADAVDLGQLGDIGLAQGLQGPEARRQCPGCGRADVAHGQGHQDAPQRAAASLAELGEHGGGVLPRRCRLLDPTVGVVSLLGPEEPAQTPVPGGHAPTGDGTPDEDLAQVVLGQVEQSGLAGEHRHLLCDPRLPQELLDGLHPLGDVEGVELAGREAEPSAFGLQAPPCRERRQGLAASGIGSGQGAGGLVSQPLDIQGAPRADMSDPLGELGGAGPGVGAAQVDVAILGRRQLSAAGGAVRRHDEVPLAAVTQVGDRPQDLRDDVAGLAHDDHVPDAHALAGHLGGVVESGAGHRRAGDEDRLHHAEGRDAAGASDLDGDVQQPGAYLLGRVLVGGGPARHSGGVAQTALEGVVVELEDDAVDLVDEVVAVGGVALDVGLALGASPHHGVVGGHRQPPAGQHLVPLVLPGGEPLPRCGGDRADPVGDHRQGPGGGDGGVLLAQRAGGRVAGVGEDLQEGGSVGLPLQIAGAALLVEGLEVLGGEVDLSAHLEQGGVGVTGQDQGDRGDGPHVAGDVLTGGAVAAGRGPGEDAVLVGQGHGQAVDLDLSGHGELVVTDPGLGDHALGPFLDLVEGEDVLKGVHALVVRGGGEVGDGAPAHGAGR